MLFTRGQAIDFVEKAFGSGALTNQGQNISVVCPVCRDAKGLDYQKKKLAIRTDNFVVHCWVCGYKSRNLLGLIKRYHPTFFKEYVDVFVGSDYLRSDREENCEDQDNKKLALPPGFFLMAMYEHHHSGKFDFDPADDRFAKQDREAFFVARKYLEERFLGEKVSDLLWYWRFGITTSDQAFSGRVIIPSFDAVGDLNYYTARALDDRVFPKYLNPGVLREDVIFNEININWTEPLTIVEGPFDMMKCGTNATCLLGSDLTTEYQLFLMLVKHKTPVVLALDPDAKDKTIKIATLLSEYDVSVSILDIPPNFKDVGEMKQSEFISLLPNATPYSRDYSLKVKIAGMLKNI